MMKTDAHREAVIDIQASKQAAHFAAIDFTQSAVLQLTTGAQHQGHVNNATIGATTRAFVVWIYRVNTALGI